LLGQVYWPRALWRTILGRLPTPIPIDSYPDLLERVVAAFEDRLTITRRRGWGVRVPEELCGLGAQFELLERLVRRRLADLAPTLQGQPQGARLVQPQRLAGSGSRNPGPQRARRRAPSFKLGNSRRTRASRYRCDGVHVQVDLSWLQAVIRRRYCGHPWLGGLRSRP
jgi:hypothetical protein